MTRPRRVVVLVDDLMVRSRIEAAAPPDTLLRFPRNPAEFEAELDLAPDLILVGLAATRQPWEELIQTAHTNPKSRLVPVLAFGPHRDLALRKRALEAGAKRVIANSALMLELPGLLQGETER